MHLEKAVFSAKRRSEVRLILSQMCERRGIRSLGKQAIPCGHRHASELKILFQGIR